MEQLQAIVDHCNQRLQIATIQDYDGAVNGLQFQNSGTVARVASAVDASLESIQQAVTIGANLLFVHHGLFWGSHAPIIDTIYQKYRLLIEHDIAVYSCHLPLDAHPEIGNNAQLAQLLQLQNTQPAFPFIETNIGVIGERSMGRTAFKAQLAQHFPHIVPMEFGPEKVRTVGISSGGSGNMILKARNYGIDTMIIGECSQHHYNIARERGLNVYLCGHYATETFGVDALGKEIAEKFHLPYSFLPSECPL